MGFFHLIFVCLKCLPVISEIQLFESKTDPQQLGFHDNVKSFWANGFLMITELLS